MPWGAVAGAAIGVIGDSMASDKNGGAGAQTNTKEPWAPAAPWLLNNIGRGQALQNEYTDRPFNAQQQQAYQNQANQGQYMRALTPDLLGQISRQQVGFDRSNPNARPNAFNFDGGTGMGSGANMGMGASGGGLLSMLTRGNAVNSSIPEAKAPVQEEPGKFMQQDLGYSPEQLRMAQFTGTVGQVDPQNMYGIENNGSFGSFKYGDPMPERGTKAYRDMSEYFAMGGYDPGNRYGRGILPSQAMGVMGNSGNSVGGSPSGDGSGGGVGSW